MRILVTGASGLIGSHLVEALVARGEEVVCLLRRDKAQTWLRDVDVETVKGDVRAPESLPPALKGVELVFHLAGRTKGGRFFEVNSEGTANLAAAVKAAAPRVGRFIFVSSQAAQGPSRPERPSVEEDPPRPVSGYGRSKLAAEASALSLSLFMPVVVLRPAIVYGPRDRDFLTLIKAVGWGVMPAPPHRLQKLSLLYVADAVQALWQAARSPLAKGVFLVSDGQVYTAAQLIQLIAAHLNLKARLIPTPKPLLALAALAAEGWGRLSGRPSIFGWDKFKELNQPGWWADPGRAKNLLGFNPQYTLAEGLPLAISWYKAHNWI